MKTLHTNIDNARNLLGHAPSPNHDTETPLAPAGRGAGGEGRIIRWPNSLGRASLPASRVSRGCSEPHGKSHALPRAIGIMMALVLAIATTAIASEDGAWLRSKSTRAPQELYEQALLLNESGPETGEELRGIRVETMTMMSDQLEMLGELSMPGPSGLIAYVHYDDPNSDDYNEDEYDQDKEPADREDAALDREDREDDAYDRENDAYHEGRSSLDNRDWEDAIEEFEEVIELNGYRKAAAMYWKALALYKLARRSDALDVLEELQRSDYVKSRWRKDAKALEMEIQQKSGRRISEEDTEDNELKMMALNALMHSNPDRALPLLEKVLREDDSFEVKERALFVLSQSDSPEAHVVIEKTASDESDPELQMKAIEYLGLFGGGEYTELLESIYKNTSSFRIKRKIIDSYWLSSQHDHLIAIAKSEDNIDLRSSATSKIALMGDGEALRDLYIIETVPELKKELIGYFMLTGDKEILVGIAKDEKDPELLEKAIGQLGIMDGGDELWILYQDNPPVKVRQQILNGIWLSGGTDRLIAVARNDSEPELREAAISKLGLMGSDEAGDGLTDLYADEDDRQVKEAILSALWLQGNDDALIAIARSEKDRTLRKKAIEKLSLMSSDKVTDFMIELLED